MLRCGNNFWSAFLRSIVLVVKAFQRQEMQLSPARSNMQQEQRLLGQHETSCHGYYIITHGLAFFQLRRARLTLSLHHNGLT